MTPGSGSGSILRTKILLRCRGVQARPSSIFLESIGVFGFNWSRLNSPRLRNDSISILELFDDCGYLESNPLSLLHHVPLLISINPLLVE